jgi:hypothetical protein
MMNLVATNKIGEDICKSNNHYTPITEDDYELFKKFFAKEPHTYGNSWIYIIQGMYGVGPNNLGYKYYDGINLSAICIYPKIEDETIHIFYWVRPMGPSINEMIVRESHIIYDKYAIPVSATKIFDSQYRYLLDHGFKSSTAFQWHSTAPEEDDTFPEVINNVKKTINSFEIKGPSRRSFKRYLKIKDEARVVLITTDEQKNRAWRIAQDFFKQNLSVLEHNLSNPYDYYNLIFAKHRENYEMYLVYFQERAVGFFDLYTIDAEHVAAHAALMLREEYPNLDDFAIIHLFQELEKRGVNYVNQGGSELPGMNKFKSKFIIEKEIKMPWAVLF